MTGELFKNLPQGPFGVIVADVPWCFATRSPKGRGRSPDGPVGKFHYDTIPTSDLKTLPISTLAGKTCRLFLWSTIPHLAQALDLMDHWQLPYKSHWIWHKLGNHGTGYWGRSQHEIILIGARGVGAAPKMGQAPGSLFATPKTRHSEKPEILQDRIDSIWPWTTKLELFARRQRPGWTCWGNEV